VGIPHDSCAVARIGGETLFPAADIDHCTFPAIWCAGLGEGEEFFAFILGEKVIYHCGEVVFVFWEWGVGFFKVDLLSSSCAWGFGWEEVIANFSWDCGHGCSEFVGLV
jgi:hypothetical protein